MSRTQLTLTAAADLVLLALTLAERATVAVDLCSAGDGYVYLLIDWS